MSEELLGFEKKKALELVLHIRNRGDESAARYLCEQGVPVVERKEYDNKIEDMRNTIELQKGLKTLFERKAIKLEQQLAEKQKAVEAERLRKNKMIEVFLSAALALGELKGSVWLDKHRAILLDKEPEKKENQKEAVRNG